ncbi:DUF2207 domain-containing protein [Spiractinospora alimapuensis]|uniref:DUF2207 domain-containing protein n=1 Tax=Spiractinospora alimapuensis TaxID=2820884 RepID=UPI001F4528A1|nr:DUF2207 domain-containing protein [Spiractinospora alimapuensis]QVQ53699.1 DUF2207 domain-containing protein [Spiractinospora alimapuensis]
MRVPWPPSPPPRLLPLACVAVSALLLTGCDIESGAEDQVTSLDIDADLAPSGTLTVTESITYDFGEEPSPGLRREIPTVAGDGTFTRESLDVDVVSVESPSGAPAEIENEEEFRGWLTLEIGDSDNEVTGEQTYTITYTVDGAVTDEGTHDELYWDFIGTGWGVPIREPEIRLSAPEIDHVECVAGELDSTDPCDSLTVDDRDVTVVEPRLDSGEALTTRVEMPSATIDVPAATTQLRPLPTWLTWSGVLSVLGALAFVALTLWLSMATRKGGNARAKKLDVSRLSPAAAGLLTTNRTIHPRHLMSMLVDLEERGFITSRKNRKKSHEWVFEQAAPVPRLLPFPVDYLVGGIRDWINARSVPVQNELSPAEARFLGAVFAQKPKAGMGTLYRNITTYQVRRIRVALRRELGKNRYVHGPVASTLGGIIAIAALLGPTVGAIALDERVALVSLNEMHNVASLIAGFGVLLLVHPLITIGETRAGQRAKAALKGMPDADLSSAHLVAIGRSSAVSEDDGFFADAAFRGDWDRRMRDRIRRSNRSRGGGGSTRSGRGSGGGGGGRR